MRGRSGLKERIERMATSEGVTETGHPQVVVVRLSAPMARTPVVYGSSLCVVAQGAKQAHLGGRVYTYDANHYLVCSVTLPVESEVSSATMKRPFLGLVLKIEPAHVSQLLLDMDGLIDWPAPPSEPSIVCSALDPGLLRTMERLLDATQDPLDCRILAPNLIREAIYSVLRGPHGHILRASALSDSHAHRVVRVVRFLEQNFKDSLEIDQIAKHAGMSPSTLHHHFKRTTTMSPMQFVKKLRLHEARSMLQRGCSATEAAYEVGYGSPSQFSREFRRLFGVPPTATRPDVASSVS